MKGGGGEGGGRIWPDRKTLTRTHTTGSRGAGLWHRNRAHSHPSLRQLCLSGSQVQGRKGGAGADGKGEKEAWSPLPEVQWKEVETGEQLRRAVTQSCLQDIRRRCVRSRQYAEQLFLFLMFKIKNTNHLIKNHFHLKTYTYLDFNLTVASGTCYFCLSVISHFNATLQTDFCSPQHVKGLCITHTHTHTVWVCVRVCVSVGK